MSTSENTAQTTTEWIFVSKSLSRTASGWDQALRCIARAGLRAESIQDWIATAAAWEFDFKDPDMARECLGKAELMAKGTGEGWDEIVGAWVGMNDFRRVVEICREVHEPRPWPRTAEIQSQGPLPNGTSVLDWLEPGESMQASRQAVESADPVMESGDTVETIRYLIDAESMAESTRDYLRISDRWRTWFPDLEEFEKTMVRAEEVVDTVMDWIQIALKWKNDFQDYNQAVGCMSAAEQFGSKLGPGGIGIHGWECVLGTWKDEFQDTGEFRRSLNEAYGEVEQFDLLTSMVVEDLDAYELFDKASLVDLGTLTDRTVSRVAAWDDEFRSKRGGGNLAGCYRFTLQEAGNITIFLTSDVDNYLYLIEGEDTSGAIISTDQGDGYGEALSMIKAHVGAGTYVVEAAASETPDSGHVSGYGIFSLRIYLDDQRPT